jgi:hypothetical protein
MTGLSLQLKSIEEKTYNRISILEQKNGHGGKSQGGGLNAKNWAS